MTSSEPRSNSSSVPSRDTDRIFLPTREIGKLLLRTHRGQRFLGAGDIDHLDPAARDLLVKIAPSNLDLWQFSHGRAPPQLSVGHCGLRSTAGTQLVLLDAPRLVSSDPLPDPKRLRRSALRLRSADCARDRNSTLRRWVRFHSTEPRVPGIGSWPRQRRVRQLPSAIRGPRRRCTVPRAASRPPSRYTAPSTASSASARIDALSAPPLAASPRPSSSADPRPQSRAASAKASALTTADLTALSSPGPRSGELVMATSQTQSPRTASPRNSKRSLDVA